MNDPALARFERLLRWYPRDWREQNGAVLVGTMLENADAQNRSAPTMTEQLSAMLYGLGARLDPRLALRAGLTALALAALAGGLWVWALPSLAASGGQWVLPMLTIAICPSLIALAAIALLSHRGILTGPRAILALGSVLPALVLAALTQIGWGIAFDAADAGVPPTGLGGAWGVLFVGGWLAGAGALSAVVHGALQRTRLREPWRTVVAILMGLIAAPPLGLALVAPSASAVGAAGVSLLALLTLRSPDHRDGAAIAGRTLHRVPVPPVRREGHARTRARILSWVAAAGGSIGVVYALTGAAWPLSTVDGTAAMGQGITVALTAALPLLAALGLLAAANARVRARHVWGPLTLLAAALGGVVVAYLNAPAWEGMAAGFAAASLLGGAAIAWWMIPRLRGPARIRVALGALVGLSCATFAAMLVAPLLAFALPVGAVIVATAGTRRPVHPGATVS